MPVVDLGDLLVEQSMHHGGVAAYVALPALPPVAPEDVVPEARPAIERWNAARAELAVLVRTEEWQLRPAEIDRLQALEREAATILTLVEATPVVHAILGDLYAHDAWLRFGRAMGEEEQCWQVQAPESCAQPVLEPAEALAEWAKIGAGAPPSLQARARLAEGYILEETGGDAISAYRAAYALPGASPILHATAAFQLAAVMSYDDPSAIALYDEAASEPTLHDAAQLQMVTWLAGHHLGEPVLVAAMAAMQDAPADSLVEYRHAAAAAIADAGPAGLELLAERGTPADRALVLALAASILAEDGHRAWALVDADAARALGPDADADYYLGYMDSALQRSGEETPQRWLYRVVSRCVEMAPPAPRGELDIMLVTKGTPRAIVRGQVGDLSTVPACLEGPIPPPEGQISGKVRAHVRIEPKV